MYFFETGNLFASRFLFIEHFQLIDMVPKNLKFYWPTQFNHLVSTQPNLELIWNIDGSIVERLNFNKTQIWSSFHHWVTRSMWPKMINLKYLMIKKSKLRFALHFSFWPLWSQSFGFKYGYFTFYQLRKCQKLKSYVVTAER